MPVDSLICFGICLAVLVIQSLLGRNLLAPISMYVLVILGTLGVALLRLMPAMTPLKPYTWTVIGLSSLAFVTGVVLARLYWLVTNKPLPYPQPLRNDTLYVFSHYDWNRHLRWFFLLLMLYAVALAKFLAKYGVPTVFSEHFLDIVGKKGMDIGYLFLPIIMYPLLLMLLFPCLMKESGLSKGKRRVLAVIFCLLFVVAFVFWPARGALMHLLVFLVVFFNLLYKRLHIMHLLGAMLVLALLFSAVAGLKKQVEKVDLTDKRFWKLPYAYIANNYWNLDYAINPPVDRELHPLTWGHQSLGGFLALEFWPDWNPIRESYHWDGIFNERVEKVGGLNTHGYWWRLYKDYWLFGICIFPLLGGMWQGWMYNRVRWRPDMPYLMVYSFMGVFIALSFFSDFWGMGTTPLYLVFLWVVAKHCTAVPLKGES